MDCEPSCQWAVSFDTTSLSSVGLVRGMWALRPTNTRVLPHIIERPTYHNPTSCSRTRDITLGIMLVIKRGGGGFFKFWVDMSPAQNSPSSLVCGKISITSDTFVKCSSLLLWKFVLNIFYDENFKTKASCAIGHLGKPLKWRVRGYTLNHS